VLRRLSYKAPDEDEIAAQQRDRLVRPAAEVGDQEAQVLRRVACGEQRLELDVADFETIAVFQEAGLGIPFRPFELPVRAAFPGQVGGHAVALHQFARPAQVVGVDMGLGHRRDLEAVLRRDGEVAVEIALGVDDDGLAAALAADQVSVLRERGVGDLPEEHGSGELGLRRTNGAAQTEHELPAHWTPERWFHGILASSIAIPHQSVRPAKVRPAPTKAARP
jgi:hypothetical protein